MKTPEQIQTISTNITVTENDVNEAGIMSTCAMLREITMANDAMVSKAFGIDSMENIRVTQYSIDIPGLARRGDMVTFIASSTHAENGILETTIRFVRKHKKVVVEICHGKFQFRKLNNNVNTDKRYANTILA